MTKQRKKEIAEEREKTRGYSLTNLDHDALLDLAVSQWVHFSEEYGKGGDSAVFEHNYTPSQRNAEFINPENGQAINLEKYVKDKSSERDKEGRIKPYTGVVKDSEMIKTASELIQGSLDSVRVGDIIERMKYKGEIPEGLDTEAYVSDLDDNTRNTLVSWYISYHTAQGVSDALGKRAKVIRDKGLESLLREESLK